MIKRLLSCLLLATLALSARAAELGEEAIARYGGLTVLRVDYLGSFKTSRAELARITSLRPGERLSAVDPEAIVQRLERTGLYSEVEIGYELEGAGIAIQVLLKEKWTVIPIPFAAYSSQSLSLGLFVMDSDFLGSMSTFATGGFWTADGWMANLAYLKRGLGSDGVGLNLFAMGGNGRRDAAYDDGSNYSSYFQNYAGAGIVATFLAGAPLRPFAGARFAWAQPETGNAIQGEVPSESAFLAPELGLSYDGQRVAGWTRRGVKATARFKLGLPVEGVSGFLFGSLGGEAVVRVPGDANLDFGAQAGYGNEPSSQSERLGGPGFRTLPFGESFSTRYIAAYSGLELPFARPPWGVLTFAAFYEGGFYETGPDGSQRIALFDGPGAGLRFYLRNIALPALGADFAYDLERDVAEFSVSLGFAM